MSRSSLTLRLDLHPQSIERTLPHSSVEKGDYEQGR